MADENKPVKLEVGIGVGVAEEVGLDDLHRGGFLEDVFLVVAPRDD